MITVPEAAKRWIVSEQRIRQWLYEKRIPGAYKLGRDWRLPDDAKRPVRKNGRKP